MFTEAQAKTKWCPFTRAPGGHSLPGASSVNRPRESAVISQDCNCIASACMAWRSHATGQPNPQYDPNSTNPQAKYPFTAIERGYCGLAGNPGDL